MTTVKVEYCLGARLKFASVASVLIALGVAVAATPVMAQAAQAQPGPAKTPVVEKIDHAAIPADPTVRRGVLPNVLPLQLHWRSTSESMVDHDSEVVGCRVQRSRRHWSFGRHPCGM